MIIAPAMNKQMFENPATQRNLNTLRADQITIWGLCSDQACGENGLGRNALEPEQLQQALQVFFLSLNGLMEKCFNYRRPNI